MNVLLPALHKNCLSEKWVLTHTHHRLRSQRFFVITAKPHSPYLPFCIIQTLDDPYPVDRKKK